MPTNLTSKKPHPKSESSNTKKEKMVALNFRVPANFKRDFKIAAATHGTTQSDLLQQAFEEWNTKHR